MKSTYKVVDKLLNKVIAPIKLIRFLQKGLKMKIWTISLLLVGSVLQGCSYTSYTTKLSKPVERITTVERYQSSIELKEGKVLSASIGDELFVMNRNIVGAVEVIQPLAPTGQPFPQGAIWTGTHRYDDGNSGILTVYTTPRFYKGTIGVILDKNEILRTNHPLVQVEGAKTGRRWTMFGSRDFFVISNNNIDSWALRYGGKKDNSHVFEIVNKHQSDTTEILQTIHINDEKFYSGFIIRKVLIEGVNFDTHGVIQYKIKDTLDSVNK